MNMRRDSGILLCRFVVIIGACAICLYSYLAIREAISSGGLSAVRYSLRGLSGIGDSNPINTAIYFGVIALASWYLFPLCCPLNKIGLIVLLAGSVSLMFLTQSRGPLISLVITLFCISVLRRRRDDLFLWGIALVAFISSVLFLDIIPSIIERANANNYRLEIWSRVASLIKENIFFGQGLGGPTDISFLANGRELIVSHSHSSIIETFRVGGLVGGFIFIAMVFLNTRPEANDERLFFLSWLVFGLLCLSTNGRLPFIRPSIEWFAFWIPLFFTVFTPDGARGSTLRKD
jgi:O-antigen ligase